VSRGGIYGGYAPRSALDASVLRGFGILRWIFRWFAGRPVLAGADWRPTDATFFRRGYRRYPGHEADRLTFWAWLPEWQRSAIRQWCLLVAIGWVLSPFGFTAWHLFAQVGTMVTGVAVVWLVVRGGLNIRHKRKYVRPLHGAVNEVLHRELPESAISVPSDFQRKGTRGVVLTLPGAAFYNAQQLNTLKSCVSQKLALPNPVMTTQGTGMWPTITFTPALEPPSQVRWCELLPAIAACRPGEVVLGIDSLEQVYRWSFKDGNPHGGFSVNTQRGKSTQAQSIVAQILHQDPRNQVTFIDPKGTSCKQLRGTPGLNLVDQPGETLAMWDAVERVYNDLMRRRTSRVADPTVEYGIHLLVLDEMSQFSDESQDLWKSWKHEQPELWQPGDSPVAKHLKAIFRMGGEFGIHVIVYTQRLDVRATFGIPGIRDLMGLRGLGGYRANQWKMLIQTTPVPRAQKGRGRWIYSTGEAETWVQNVYSSDGTKETWEREIRAWAQENRKGYASYEAPASAPTDVPGEVTRVKTERLFNMAQVSVDDGQGIVPLKANAIRQAKKRASDRGDQWPDMATEDEWKRLLRVQEPVG